MNAIPKNISLLWSVLLAGFTGFTARAVLYRIGVDGQGLLPRFHILHLLCILLTILVAGYLLLRVRKLDGYAGREENFPLNLWRVAVGLPSFCLLMMHAFALTSDMGNILSLIRVIMAFSAGTAVALCGYLPTKNRRPPMLLHGVICLFFVTEMICRYQVWSGNPQLPDYCFHLLACAFLTISAYQRTAFDAGMGNRRAHIFCSLIAIFLCMLSLIGPEQYEFYLGSISWVGASICTLDPPEAPEVSVPVPEQEDG